MFRFSNISSPPTHGKDYDNEQTVEITVAASDFNSVVWFIISLSRLQQYIANFVPLIRLFLAKPITQAIDHQLDIRQ